jgi:hypothetical protein
MEFIEALLPNPHHSTAEGVFGQGRGQRKRDQREEKRETGSASIVSVLL